MERSIGQVAALAGVTVRTLHHYDEIGLLRPSGRSTGGYRVYADADLERLHRVLSYRELGFSLEQIASVLDDPLVDAGRHLQNQHVLVRERIARLRTMLAHIEREMEAQKMGIALTPDEQFEVFGKDFRGAEYAAEAEERWGDTDAWAQSRQRTSAYTKADWVAIKAEGDAAEAGLAEAMQAGVPSSDVRAMDLAEGLRLQIDRRFYDCPPGMHRSLADMYLADPRFAAHYDDRAAGLAQYVHDAIHANADRQEAQAGQG